MDANGTRFHLFLGRDDWARCSAAAGEELHLLRDAWQSPALQHATGLYWNHDRNEVTLEPRLFNFAPNGSAPSLENRRGAARDRFGNWYWIDETSLRVRVLSSGSRTTSDFWRLPETCACADTSCSGDFQPLDQQGPAAVKLSGLAVTENYYLVVGTIDPAGLLIFDLYSGGDPRQLFWPAEVDFVPFDMAPRKGGGVWILDRVNRCYWGLDRNFNVIGDDASAAQLSSDKIDDFQPIDASSMRQTAGRTFPSSFSLQQSPLSLIDPIAIEALPDGTVLILDDDQSQKFSKLYRYRCEERLPDDISTASILQIIEAEHKEAFQLRGYDIAFVPEHTERGRRIEDRLYVTGADGNQTYAFRICLRGETMELQPVSQYLPMRLFGGKGLVGAETGVCYDFAEDWIALVPQHRPRYSAEATLLSPTLDGRDPDCVWHRLMLDACIPPETKVEIWSRAANDERDLAFTPWQSEPLPYLRAAGSEIPFLRWTRSTNGHTSSLKLGDGTWELLFQRARGRYLQLRLHLSGDERNTPRLSAMRVYFPRFSYLTNYLPAVYREDEQSGSFLDRFLANLEGVHTTLEDKIASAQILFDVRSAPREVLDWLAGWFEVALDPSWDEPKRRMFIAHAMEFFQYRGTIRGLTMALHLALDPCADETIFSNAAAGQRREQIRLIEKYLTRKIPAAVLGDPGDATGPRTVVVAPAWTPDQGRGNLNQRYSKFVDPSGGSTINYPLALPGDAKPADAETWTQFSQSTLGFVPSIYAPERLSWQVFLRGRYATIASLNSAHQTAFADFADISLPRDFPKAEPAQNDWSEFVTGPPAVIERRLWQDFLARRYRRINSLNYTYGTAWRGFDGVALPDELPRDGAPLNDWWQFETVMLRMQRTAHRFTVLLPVPAALAFDTDEHQRRLDLAHRIVELEKPAHTVFDVRFYWAMFRVGEARLQLDTLMDQGSRAPQLLPNLILGQGFVGESYLAPPALEDAGDRNILGRDALGITPN